MKGNRWVCACFALGLGLPGAVAAQSNGPPIEVGGLLRTGFRLEPQSSGEPDGFDVYDARFRVRGEVGIVFDYFLQAFYNPRTDRFELLDAKATLPVIPEFRVAFGMFRPPFGYEALLPKGQLTLVERAEAVTAISPGRQVGIEVGGRAVEGRLTYGAGLFNGNGRALENDGDDYMFAASARFNSIGEIAFYDDFVFQIGGSIARASDTAAPLPAGNIFSAVMVPELTTAFDGDRTMWGLDFQATYRGWALTAEVVGADYEFDSPILDGITEASTTGAYVELGYRAFGAIEAVARYDGIEPAVGARRDYLVTGINVYPGYYAKFGIQLAVPLDDSPDGAALHRNQFLFLAQVDF